METVSFEFKKPRRIPNQGCLSYGEHEARPESRRDVDVPKLEGSTKGGGTEDDRRVHRRRKETIARFIMDQPIFALCQDGERRRGLATRTFWWEQPLTLDDPEALPDCDGAEGDGT